eukprot:CAMPEP_0181289490 /NCGR_PEP_ID=MMETSP1101-20121128/908_1 /TAXON_ID=46948 /ORGANISM="Rhodomonas abbreviata, Strain Caron Lab Isolate" /LENGTH=724 /DNA_ID=CAMNT_0023393711 /DNA_START=129 /DNA_END=2303 /DNA_ORIENTATION=+
MHAPAFVQTAMPLFKQGGASTRLSPSQRVPLAWNNVAGNGIGLKLVGKNRPRTLGLAQLTSMSDHSQVVPPPSKMKGAHVSSMDQYHEMYKRSLEDPDGFWSDMAKDLYWKEKWHTVNKVNFDLSKGPVSIEWFLGSKTNLAYNALDKHVNDGKGDNVMFIWEGNDGEQQSFTYSQVLEEVSQFSNALRGMGVKKGDTVAIYLPMVVQLPIAMLACARIGAVHSVVFGGFSAEALASRIEDCKASVVVTADGVMRGKKPLDLYSIANKALSLSAAEGHTVENVVVVGRLKEEPELEKGHVLWSEAISAQSKECEVEWMDAEDPLFLLYTSGSTGKPKGVVHSTAGYMVWSYATFKNVFDYREGDTFWCTADCGWITGHSYITYGPSIAGATQVLFEGVPTYPTPSRAWEIVERYKVNQFYTAPTAIRSLMSFGEDPVKGHDLSSLRVLGSVGEPINPEAWKWYHQVVGNEQCPIVDTWWQTETGGHMITSLPGATPQKPGSATLPFFGVEPTVLDSEGNELEGVCEGYLAFKRSWPGQLRGVYGDTERYENTYFRLYNGNNELISDDKYIAGDACRRDKDGYYWITGRIDDVINVSGHRIGTAELESALVEHSKCAEAAVVAFPHPIKGEAIYAFVTLTAGEDMTPDVQKELKMIVRSEIGAFAAPDKIHWAPGLPKTRSGKILRRVLRKIASGTRDMEEFGDVSTIADPSVVTTLLETAKDAA